MQQKNRNFQNFKLVVPLQLMLKGPPNSPQKASPPLNILIATTI